MRKVYLIILLFNCGIAFGQKTIFWRVTDTITNNSSYVLGTAHIMGNSFVDSLPQIKMALKSSELAIFESIITTEDSRKEINSRERSYEIEKKLKKKDLLRLKEVTRDWKVDIYKLKPVEITWGLAQRFYEKKCKTVKSSDEWVHFDRYLMHLAKSNKIQVLGLETDSLQLSTIEKEYQYPGWKKERKNIRYYTEQLLSDNSDLSECEFFYKYMSFEQDYAFNELCYVITLEERNKNWLQIIPDLLRQKSCFIAVGFLHLKYKCGLLEQLKNLGFVVEPIELGTVER